MEAAIRRGVFVRWEMNEMWGVGQVKVDLGGHVEIEWYYSLKYNYLKGTTRKLGLNLSKRTTSDCSTISFVWA